VASRWIGLEPISTVTDGSQMNPTQTTDLTLVSLAESDVNITHHSFPWLKLMSKLAFIVRVDDDVASVTFSREFPVRESNLSKRVRFDHGRT
jgi:hypothetical protein